MTLQEFNNINWHRGNVVKLDNGKEYFVKGVKKQGKYLLLFSAEYDSCFLADYNIIDCRTSDYEEPDEVYLEKKRQKQEAAQAKIEEERLKRLKAKAERKLKNMREQERIHLEAVARKAAKAKNKMAAKAKSEVKQEPEPVKQEPKPTPTPAVEKVAEPQVCENEQPKKKRKRIMISRVEKVEIK